MGAMDAPAMLAYVFWHWMRADGDVAAYEDALTAFQQALLDNAPTGYRRAAVFRHAPAPWLPGPPASSADSRNSRASRSRPVSARIKPLRLMAVR